MTNRIFDKTDKGREEISTRKYQLASRLRTLLVLIDGKHYEEDLLKTVSGLGLNEQSMTELLDSGFTRVIEITPSNIFPVFTPETPESGTTDDEQEPAAILPTDARMLQAAQYQALANFFTETIKSTIGLRGYGLQLKVERAASVDDFRALRQPYLDAVLKAKGTEIARSLGERLDQLLKSD